MMVTGSGSAVVPNSRRRRAHAVLSLLLLLCASSAASGLHLRRLREALRVPAAAHGKQGLIPGMTDATAGTVNDIGSDVGVRGSKISKAHMGEIHVCNDNWEDCEGQERNATKKAEKTAPLHVDQAPDPANRTCKEYGPTVNGCECIDSCVCKTQTFCQTRAIATEAGENSLVGTSPCGAEVDWMGNQIDDCTYLVTPPQPPRMNYYKKPEIKWADDDVEYYRAFGGDEGNQRYLPKKGCYSRKLFCVQFPKFRGCNPDITYSENRLTDEQRAELEGCNAITERKQCDEHQACGKGEHKNCHNDCLWGDDAPGWFREMRRKQNVKIRTGGDPVHERNSDMLPVLQPAYAGEKGAGRLRNSNMGQRPKWARSKVPDSGTSRRRRTETMPPPILFPR